MAETLYEKGLRLLAGMGRNVSKAVDPDDADSRVPAEAEPTDKKLEAAGEEAAAGGGAQGGEGGDPAAAGGDPAGVPADATGGEDANVDDSDLGEDAEGDDMTDEETRELRKAFGLTDFDGVDEIKKGTDTKGMLTQILSYVQGVDAYMKKLTSELAALKTAHSSGKADGDLRNAMKSLDEKVDNLQSLMEGMTRTAPAAAQPKAIVKAMDPTASVQPKSERITTSDLTHIAMTGGMSALEVARLNRQIHNH
jgi:hypothetical protein